MTAIPNPLTGDIEAFSETQEYCVKHRRETSEDAMTEPVPFLAAAGLTVQRPDGTLERVVFADGATWELAGIKVLLPDGTVQRWAPSDDLPFDALAAFERYLAAMADDTATSREAAVESNARQTIADLTAGRVGSQTVNDIAQAVGRARTDSAAGRAINRGMERE